ncbi:MAG: PDZ domain-containing protein [Phycisphaeraceae bacterium]|nr:PDZ domain-containing protein [Phycisphaeraceae bacterium]
MAMPIRYQARAAARPDARFNALRPLAVGAGLLLAMAGAGPCPASAGLVADQSEAAAPAPATPASPSVALSVATTANEPSVHSGHYQFVRDGQRVEVSMRNGVVTSAKMDGRDVPAERVRLEGRTLTITDADGQAVFSHEFASEDAGVTRRTRSIRVMGPGDPAAVQRFVSPRAAEARALALSAQAQAEAEAARARAMRSMVEAEARALVIEPPSVMIGVQMAPAPDVLCGHLGIEPGKAVLVSAVHEGLPAHAAGLRPYDLIVGMDGSEGVVERDLRARLREMKAGDAIALTVIHRGERRTVSVSPVPYDAGALENAKVEAIASARVYQSTGPGGMPSWFAGDRDVFAVAPSAPAASGGPAGDGSPMIIQIEPFGDADFGAGFGGFSGADALDERVERAIHEALRRLESARDIRGAAPGGRAGSSADLEQMREQMLRMERMMQQLMERHGQPVAPAEPVVPTPPVRVPEKSS